MPGAGFLHCLRGQWAHDGILQSTRLLECEGMTMKTLELETSECFLLCVALREYLGGQRRSMTNDVQLVDHPSSMAVIEGVLKRLDPPAEGSS